MAKKKVITTKAIEQEEFNPEPIEASQDEATVVKSVAKKKGLSSFGAMLKAANEKRKERKKQYGKED